eukprot:m.162494 g.162494  ORF g.162494 m.162494 type:complete len:720 (+) comp53062_c0_seq19:54-2213(+)
MTSLRLQQADELLARAALSPSHSTSSRTSSSSTLSPRRARPAREEESLSEDSSVSVPAANTAHIAAQLLKTSARQNVEKAQLSARVSELEDRLQTALYHRNLLQTKLDSTDRAHREDLQLLNERMNAELNEIRERQQQIESAQPTAESLLREAWADLEAHRQLLTHAQYEQLRQVPTAQLRVSDFVQLRLYEEVSPLVARLDTLTQESEPLMQQLQQAELNAAEWKAAYARAEERLLAVCGAKTSPELFPLVTQLDGENPLKRLALLEAQLQGLRDLDSRSQLAASDWKHQIQFLSQDKNYLTKEKEKLERDLAALEGKHFSTLSELQEVKHARDSLYQKMLDAQQQLKSDYDSKLRSELDSLQTRSSQHMAELKQQAHSIHEHEKASLKSDRDNAIERLRLSDIALKECQRREDHLQQQLRQFQLEADSCTTDLRAQLQIKAFELQRLQVLFADQQSQAQAAKLETDKTAAKLEVLTKEFYAQQNMSDKRIASLEAQLAESNDKVRNYELLERELDDVIMQAAQSNDDDEILLRYGYGANGPSTSKRRLKQSVALARKLLQAQREILELTQKLEQERASSRELGVRLQKSSELMQSTTQPYSYLMEIIKQRDGVIEGLRLQMDALHRSLKDANAEIAELLRIRNIMSADLEHLLGQHSDIENIRSLLHSGPSRPEPPPIPAPARSHTTSTSQPMKSPGLIEISNSKRTWHERLRSSIT